MSTAAERQQSPDFEKKAFNSEIFEISVEHASHDVTVIHIIDYSEDCQSGSGMGRAENFQGTRRREDENLRGGVIVKICRAGWGKKARKWTDPNKN